MTVGEPSSRAAAAPAKPYFFRTGIRARILKMLLSVLLAWFAGYLASLPIQMLELARIADGNRPLLFSSLGGAILVWAVVTGTIALCILVIFLGPVATMVSPAWLWRSPKLSVLALPCVSVAAVSIELKVWEVLEPEPYPFRSMLLAYGIFGFTFSLVTGVLYLRQTAGQNKKPFFASSSSPIGDPR